MADAGMTLASVLVPVRNEQRHIRAAVESVRAQECDGVLEFLFIDGRSSDGTREVLDELAGGDSRLRVLDNPAGSIPEALNLGLQEASGEFIVRMDAHSLYPVHYVSDGIERLRRGDVACVTGAAVPYGTDRASRRTALALQSQVGTGGSRFRHARDQEIEVRSGPFGVWRRTTLEALGGWDVGWPVNQDAELAARLRKAGGRIVMTPELDARYIPRSGLRAVARQYRRYGFYRAKTSLRHPETVRPSYFFPPTLILVWVMAALGPRRLRGLSRAGLAAYLAVLVGAALRTGVRGAGREARGLPGVYLTMHLSWGTGLLVGLLRNGRAVPAWRDADRNNRSRSRTVQPLRG